jgi:hypothetical protein
MRTSLPLRLLIAVGLSLGLAVLLLVLLYATNVAFEVYEHLREAPLWFFALYVAGLGLLAALGVRLIWRVVAPRRRRRGKGEPKAPPPPPTEAEVKARIERAVAAGAEAEAEVARRELEELAARREAGQIHVALLGPVSTGKSSLVRALLPDATTAVSPVGGTTREVTRYTWASPAGDRLVLSDLPGLLEADGTLDRVAREEALRAHLVVYLIEGDLTRDQLTALHEVLALGKPVVLALGKSDLLSEQDLETLRARLAARVSGGGRVEVVTVSAGAERELVRVHPDGREEVVTRVTPARVGELARAIQRRIDGDREVLDGLRDASVFVLAARKLDESLAAHRRARAAEVVSSSTRKAVLGALAAVSPGTDVLIQGYLGFQMLRGLADVYEVPMSKVDVERFLFHANSRVNKTVPVLLAVAGNALKAFPGIGTLTGGVVHAVAYGLLFDSLGRAVADTLAARGGLPEQVALKTFEEKLSEDVEGRARRLARIVLAEGRGTRAASS